MAEHANDAKLLAASKAAREKAYVPYSGFAVGAAILADDGNIYGGANVENAAYPVGNCAEPSAIAAMLMGGGKRIARIYITGRGTAPTTPCGACRQRIREFGDPQTVIVSHGLEGEPLYSTLEDMLPHAFGHDHIAG